MNRDWKSTKITLTIIKNEIEAEYWLKKLESAEKKIKDFNEVIFGINLLKFKNG